MGSFKRNIGILGGGQLGKMLVQAAGIWDIPIHVLDKSRYFPAGNLCPRFTEGDFNSYNDVLSFCSQMDIVSIEIEHVNTKALFEVQQKGIFVHPDPSSLEIIKDKGLQKQFFTERNLPTSDFQLFENDTTIRSALKSGKLSLPFVQKSRTAGYDGQGVAIIRNEGQIDNLMPAPSLIEPLVPIQKELAVIVARNQLGQVKAYTPVEMVFDPIANLVDYLICPAAINQAMQTELVEIAIETIKAFKISGILAVEFFLTTQGKLLINEVAPRPHNSGHHTIENTYTSQFQQHLRAIMNLPLGNTTMRSPALMVNLLGEKGHRGKARYSGLEKCLKIEGVFVHLYGKKECKPFRKMGHVTILDHDLASAKEKARFIRNTIKITT